MASVGLKVGNLALDDFFDALIEGAALDHDAPPATLADEADVEAEAHDLPFVSAAGVLFA